MGTESLHRPGEERSFGEIVCVCGYTWIEVGDQIDAGGTRSSVARCSSHGTVAGDVWELKQLVAELARVVAEALRRLSNGH